MCILYTQTLTQTYEEKDLSGSWWEAVCLRFHFTQRLSVLNMQWWRGWEVIVFLSGTPDPWHPQQWEWRGERNVMWWRQWQTPRSHVPFHSQADAMFKIITKCNREVSPEPSSAGTLQSLFIMFVKFYANNTWLLIQPCDAVHWHSDAVL